MTLASVSLHDMRNIGPGNKMVFRNSTSRFGLIRTRLTALTPTFIPHARAHTHAAKSYKEAGTIASVFATLSGGDLSHALPDRFLQLKRSIVRDEQHAKALTAAWHEVLGEIKHATAEVDAEGARLIPQVEYPGDAIARQQRIDQWMDRDTLETIKARGTVVIKNVLPKEQSLQLKHDIRKYIQRNPHTRGFPEENPQVFELYWSKAQLAARGHPSMLHVSRAILSLWHAPESTSSNSPPLEGVLSKANPLTYCDRLRIRLPGDATFALGSHIDGGGVERWEDPTFRACWSSILTPHPHGSTDWRNHDSWSVGLRGERLRAKTDMYNAAGACSVFRPLQGWLSMSSTGTGEGTLRVLPFIKAATAYIILKPFFRPHCTREELGNDEARYLAQENWYFDISDSHFDGCTLGRNIELNTATHPHLCLDRTMVSIPRVEPGDVVFWHCDVVHAVEAQHKGAADSSVLYIPAIPLTLNNFHYIKEQRSAFESGIPPDDFPGGQGESRHRGRGTAADIKEVDARRAMGLEMFAVDKIAPDEEKRLVEYCNAQV